MSKENGKQPFIIKVERNTNPDVFIKNEKGYSRKLVINRHISPINPIQCGKQNCPPEYAYGPAIRSFYLLHFVISGKGEFTNAAGTHEVQKDQVFIIRPYETTYYKADKKEPWSYVWLGFTSEIPLPPILDTSDVVNASFLKNIFLSAYDDEHFQNTNTQGAYEYYLCGLIWQIFGLLLKEKSSEENIYERYVLPAISIMESEYQSQITVPDIAARLHISRGYFFDIFKKETGVSPKKYLNDLRMKKATELMIEFGFNATMTASSIGYPDVFAFSRAFKTHFGCSPTEYLSKNKKL